MVNKKRVLLDTLVVSVILCAVSTLVAYVWTDGGEGLNILLVWYVAIASFASTFMLTLLMQVISVKLDKKKAHIILAIIVIALISLGLWGM